ncbi:MAG: type III PLP-dependent enzyme [Hamadaea sp.]|nr:type III PLP-dependent enzyme [Hamadaea sp.]
MAEHPAGGPGAGPEFPPDDNPVVRLAAPPPPRVLAALAQAARPMCAYVYDTEVLAERAAAVREALPPGATLLYAVKANGHPGVVGALAAATDGLEVASGGELDLAVRAGARKIAFGGPAKTDDELRAAFAAAATAAVTVHVESVEELRRLAWLAAEHPVPVSDGRAPGMRVALRVNRAVPGPPGTHAMTGATPTPFGIDEEMLPAVADLARRVHVPIAGFHLHAVSNSLDAAAYAQFVTHAVGWAGWMANVLAVPLSYVNVGGGFGISYADPRRSFDLSALKGVDFGAADGVELAFEPGRFLTADAGWYAAEVLDLKRTRGRWFAVLRGGTHHFRLPAAWRYNHPFAVVEVEDWPYPWRRPEVSDVAVDAVGELCTPRDVLCRGLRVTRLRVGDVLVFPRTGGYGYDISHREFLRHPHPEVIVL